MIYSSPFKNIFTLDLWSDGDSRDDSCLPFSLTVCKTPGNCFPTAFSRVAKGWRVMLESQDFQAEQWVVLDVAFSFTRQVLFEKLPLWCLKRWTQARRQSRSLATSFTLFPFHTLVIIFKCVLSVQVPARWLTLYWMTDTVLGSGFLFLFRASWALFLKKKMFGGKNKYLFPHRKYITVFHLFFFSRREPQDYLAHQDQWDLQEIE